jgi:hypothetical protein
MEVCLCHPVRCQRGIKVKVLRAQQTHESNTSRKSLCLKEVRLAVRLASLAAHIFPLLPTLAAQGPIFANESSDLYAIDARSLQPHLAKGMRTR